MSRYVHRYRWKDLSIYLDDLLVVRLHSRRHRLSPASFQPVNTNRPHSGGLEGHCCWRVVRLATSQGLLDLSARMAAVTASAIRV